MSYIRRSRLALAVAALLSVSGVPGAQAQNNEDKIVLLLPTPPATYALPQYIAEDVGLFKKYGLQVEVKTVGGDQNAIRAVLSGAGDVAILGAPVHYQALESGANIKAIGGGWQQLIDYFLVMGAGKGTKASDAAGKTIAVSTTGGMPHLLTEMIIKHSSGENSTAKYVAVGGQSARLQAVVAGKADGTLTDTLNALRGERAGQVKIVANAADYSPVKIAHSYAAVSQAALNDPKKRKALVAYTKAIIEGSRLIMSKPDLAADSMYARLKGDVDLPLLKTVVAKLNEQHAFTANGQMDPELHASTTKTYLGFKLITKPLPFEQAFDRTLEDEAMKELGRTN